MFLHGFGERPAGLNEALGWLRYRERIYLGYEFGETLSRQLGAMSFSQRDAALQRLVWLLDPPRRPLPPASAAVSLLSLRAAHRAVAASPDHPDCCFALYQALLSPELPLSAAERTLAQVAALRQCLNRFPKPERYLRNIYLSRPHEIASTLALLYYGETKGPGLEPIGLPIDLPATQVLVESKTSDGAMGMGENGGRYFTFSWRDRGRIRNVVSGPSLRAVDLAHDVAVLAGKYAAVELDPEKDKQKLQDVKRLIDATEEDLTLRKKEYDRIVKENAGMKLPGRVQAALRYQLVGTALALLTDPGVDLSKEYGTVDAVDAMLVRAALELVVGRIEDVAAGLKGAPAAVQSLPLSGNYPPTLKQYKLMQINSALYQKLLFEGDYKAAGALFEEQVGSRVAKEPPPSLEQLSFNTDSFAALGSHAPVQILQLAPQNALAQLVREPSLSVLLEPYFQRQQTLITVRMTAAEYYYRRGFLSLLEGDVATVASGSVNRASRPFPRGESRSSLTRTPRISCICLKKPSARRRRNKRRCGSPRSRVVERHLLGRRQAKTSILHGAEEAGVQESFQFVRPASQGIVVATGKRGIGVARMTRQFHCFAAGGGQPLQEEVRIGDVLWIGHAEERLVAAEAYRILEAGRDAAVIRQKDAFEVRAGNVPERGLHFPPRVGATVGVKSPRGRASAAR